MSYQLLYHMSSNAHTQVDDTSAEQSRANYAAFWINKKSVNVTAMGSCQVQVVHSYYGNLLWVLSSAYSHFHASQ